MNLPKTTKMGTQKVKKVPIRILFPQCMIPHLERMNRLKQLLGKCESDIGLESGGSNYEVEAWAGNQHFLKSPFSPLTLFIIDTLLIFLEGRLCYV